jgi:uncharacterized protein (DUF1697 family)
MTHITPSTQWIAFLRAINVGGHVVKMEHLRALFSGCGFDDVATFIASGNVIFTSRSADRPALEAQIEQALECALGYPVASFLRTPAEVAAVGAAQPFPADLLAAAGTMLYVLFLKHEPQPTARQRLAALANQVDHFELIGRELYWMSCRSQGDSRVSGAQLERALAAPGTARNISTVRKLAAKYG